MHVAIGKQKKNETYVNKDEPIFRPKQYRDQCDEVYQEINQDKKMGAGPTKANPEIIRHFVLTNVGSRKEQIQDEYHKISENYKPGNRLYETQNSDQYDTFINKMMKKCAYDPTKSDAVDPDDHALAREQYKTELSNRILKREIHKGHLDQIYGIFHKERDRVAYLISEKGANNPWPQERIDTFASPYGVKNQ